MLSDNIKNLRTIKGLSQDELAIRLNVVRQTVSKWERGLSVPDSEILINIAKELDTTVSVLLGETIQPNDNLDIKTLATKLEILNEQMANHNNTIRKIWRTIFIIVLTLSVFILIGGLVGFIYLFNIINNTNAIIGGVDGPTAVFVAKTVIRPIPVIIAGAATIFSLFGIYLTRKNKH